MEYEEICKSLNAHNREIFEQVEEAIEIEEGRTYKRLEKPYFRFVRTLDLNALQELADIINDLTGQGLRVMWE